MPPELNEYFSNLETKIEPLEEFPVGRKIEEILKVGKDKITDKKELAELFAFQFIAHYSHETTSWGTYYGPMYVWPNKEGQFVEFPSIRAVDKEVIEYWRERANTAKHPILICRYADLVVDFEPPVMKKPIDYLAAQKVIDATIRICEENLSDGLGCKEKLRRALDLAKQINDSDRLLKLKAIIIETEKKFAEDDKPGLWGYAFNWLLIDDEKIFIDDTEKDGLINDLEQRLTRLMDSDNPDAWNVECAVRLLAEYYANTKNESALKSSLDKLEKALRANKYANSDGLLIINYLERLSEIYSTYAQFQFAKDAARRITEEIGTLGDRGKFAIQEISVEVPIKKEEIEKFIQSIFGDNDPAQLEKIIARLVVNFVPKKDAVEKQLKDISQNHPLQYIMGHKIVSDDGYPIAEFGSITEDYDQHLLQHFSQNLHFQSVFLSLALEELKKRYTPDSLYDAVQASPVFRGEDKDYILQIFRHFWNRDYLSSSSLIVPLIEDAIRNLFRINNLSFIKKSEDGTGYDVQSLTKLLHRGLVKNVFGNLGENMEYYFQVLLTAKVGWNLRNNFAHGINKRSFAGGDVANRLLHILLCLSLVRKRDDSTN
jgi:hypothetical protein